MECKGARDLDAGNDVTVSSSSTCQRTGNMDVTYTTGEDVNDKFTPRRKKRSVICRRKYLIVALCLVTIALLISLLVLFIGVIGGSGAG